MADKKITLKHLASILGVSVSTVSKALNDSPEIGEQTKKRIQDVAKLHNYQPNKIAVNLKSGKTYTIGVIIPSIQNFFFAQVLLGIEKVIANSKFNIVISLTDESFNKEKEAVLALANGVVDGFIIAVAEETQTKKSYDHLRYVLNNNKPIVMFDRVVKRIDCDKVLVDDYKAIYEVTNYLIGKKRKNIALVSTIFKSSVGKSRTKGYKEALINAFGVLNEGLIVETDANTVKTKTDAMLKKHKNIDSIIALDEDSSLAALKCVKSYNYKIPKDIAVLGYANDRIAANLTPELTTIDQHGVTIGEKTANMILNKLNNKMLEVEEVLINSTVRNRETT